MDFLQLKLYLLFIAHSHSSHLATSPQFDDPILFVRSGLKV